MILIDYYWFVPILETLSMRISVCDFMLPIKLS